MSGGHFDYNQYRLTEMADEIEHLVANNSLPIREWDGSVSPPYSYSEQTILKFKEAVALLKKANIAVQRIDWLVSGDDGEDSFHERWKEDMEKLHERELIIE